MSIIKRMAAIVDKTPIKSARWYFDCSLWHPTESEWLHATSGVQEDEKIRIAKFMFKRDSKYSMVGRLMIRKFIVDSTFLDWNVISLSRDSNNKPIYVNDDFNVQFNVSHQGNYAVLAGESGFSSKLGVDVMKIEYSGGKSVAEFFRIMNRQFSDHEWSVIKSQDTEWEQLKHFYRFWCLKESYVKATGTGITVNLKQISFKLNSPLNSTSAKFVYDTELFLSGVKQYDWTFEEMLIDSEHCCAVALNVPNTVRDYTVEKFRSLGFNELIKDLKPVTPLDVAYCRGFLAKEDAPL